MVNAFLPLFCQLLGLRLIKLRIIHTEAEPGGISMLKGIATKCNLLQEIISCGVRRFLSPQVIHKTRYCNVVMVPLSKQYQMTIEGSVYRSWLPPETLHTQKSKGDNAKR